MFDRNTITALVVVGLILIFLPTYYKWVSPPPPEPLSAPSTIEAEPQEQTPKPTEQQQAIDKADIVQDNAMSKLESLASDTGSVETEYVTVETPLFWMTLASNGQVTRYELKEYVLENGKPITLHRPSGRAAAAIGFTDFNFGSTNPKSTKNIKFDADRSRLNVLGGIDSVVFRTGNVRTQEIVLTYIFRADEYGFTLNLSTSGLAVPETGEFQALWRGGVPSTEPDPARDFQYAGAYARVGDHLEEVSVSGKPGKEFSATGQTHFVAARSKYFIAALIPAEPAAGADIIGINPDSKNKDSQHFYDLSLRQPWKGEAAGRWTVYWGPMKYERLKQYGVGLDETMNWGWKIIKPFSVGVLWSLTALHRFIHNYGIVIIIFSVLVKVILWPLTRKSQISMKKMAALQPEIQALRETHKKNPQALNQAIMKLYKERGANPASGCIPLLPQMPLLYALFIIFSTTIEFRQAPFILWITDLGQPDVIFHLPFSIPLYGSGVALLPLVMGVTQFFMSKKTVTDPNQKLMIYIMPVFMTLIFNQFPSGLTLYYTLFNVLAMVEQRMIKIPDFTPSVEVVNDKKGKKKG